jgi:GNAT superfamily N-acetyltransferase
VQISALAMTDYHATLAAPDDVDAVHALLSAAGDRLAAGGFPNWLPAYPRERVAENISDRLVWIVREASGADLVATYALRPLSVHPYNGVEWADPSAIARYLNRLAVHPAQQGRGVGRWCLQRVAEQCATDGATAVRCDVLQANVPLRRFYERNGYTLRGDRFHSGWWFAVYERVIAASD